MAASQPLLPALVPARSIACSMVSVVNTPKATGMPSSRLTAATPLLTSAGDVIKMRGGPANHRAQTDQGIMRLWPGPAFWRSREFQKHRVPGTPRYPLQRLRNAPRRPKDPPNSFSVIKSLNLETTMPKFQAHRIQVTFDKSRHVILPGVHPQEKPGDGPARLILIQQSESCAPFWCTWSSCN